LLPVHFLAQEVRARTVHASGLKGSGHPGRGLRRFGAIAWPRACRPRLPPGYNTRVWIEAAQSYRTWP